MAHFTAAGKNGSIIQASLMAMAVLLALALLYYIAACGAAHALSPPGVAWQKAYGGPADDELKSVVQCPDGGYIAAGFTYSSGSGGSDVYLLKTDSNGNQQWSKTYGGSADDLAYAVNLTSDGGYIVTGYTHSFGNGGADVYLLKTDANGNLQWSKTYGGKGNDSGCSVFQDRDGGYVVGGYTSSFGNGSNDFYLLKTDASGNLLWSKTYGGPGDDDGKYVIPTWDGGYAFLGYTDSFGAGSYDLYLIKTDRMGNVQWTNTYGGSGRDFGQFLRETSDGGYVMAGLSTSYGNGYHDALMVKVDSSGQTQWIKTYGGPDFDEARGVEQMSDGGYVLAGQTYSYGDPNGDIFVVKTDAAGNQQWTATYGGTGAERAWSMDKTLDGGVIIAGSTTSYGSGGSDAFLIKLNPIVPAPTPTPTPKPKYLVENVRQTADYKGRTGPIELFTIAKGSTVTQYINYTNLGTSKDSYKVTITGIPSKWCSISISSSSLNPGRSRLGHVNIKPTVSGKYTFTIKVASKAQPSVYSCQTYVLNVI